MAIRTDLANNIKNHQSAPNGTEWDEVWDGHTGQEVETFITEKLKANEDNQITEATFAGTTLTLNRKSGDPITCTVVVADPVYTYGIYAYGLVLNGDYSNIYRQQTTLTTQYSAGKTFHLGVVLLGYTDTVGNKNDLTNTHQITITYNDKSMVASIVPTSRSKVNTDLEGNITSVVVDDVQSEIAWIDVTELFKESNVGQLKASYSFDVKSGGTNTTMSGEYTLPIGTITNEVVNISYNGNVINNTTSAQFVTDRDDSAYQLRGYVIKNNGDPEQISLTKSLTYDNLEPGLNQFYVRAENINNSSVCTDYLAVDIICTVGLTTPVVAINDVNDTIANNGVATLYNLTVYSPEGTDEVLINTYIYDSMLSNPEDLPDSALVKSESIDDSDYDSGVYQTSYKKYMEIPGGGSQYMYVKINSEWYKYIVLDESYLDTVTSKEMIVEALDSTLTYYSSGVSLTFDQIKGSANNVFKTKAYYPNDSNISESLETSDGWVEEDGRTLFRVSAQESPVFTTPLSLDLQNSFTIEFGFKAYNISDEHQPILTLGNLHLRPTQLCWNTNQSANDELNNDTFTSRNAQFREDTETHVLITFKKDATIKDDGIYYPDYLDAYGTDENLTKLDNQKINLIRIYINGGIDREFMISNAELEELQNATLQINPKSADVDFYILRVYNSACLNFNQVQRNYISFLKTKSSKQTYYKKNDILGTNGEISFNKARQQYNTIVYVYPSKYKKIDGITNDTGRFPNRAWGYVNNSPAQDAVMKKAHVTLFVNYADPDVNKIYGGRINKGQVKGQGSSAARYLIWNVGYQLNKFKDDAGKKLKSEFIPYEWLGTDNRFTENAKATKGYYVMPKYDGEKDQYDYQATKLVGKVNFASSMQSHKIGACKLYDDAFKNSNKMPTTEATTDTCFGSKKAVHEEPFLYFYWEPDMDNDAVDNVELADVIAAGQDVKFMGFHTWGPAKKDKAYFGYSDKTPEYILIEGGENKDPAANFRIPWHALQRANEDLTADTSLSTYKLEDYPTTPYNPDESWKRLLIQDESICYRGTTGALDLDFGAKEDPTIATEDEVTTYWEIADSAHTSINKFREFYDFVYVNDFTTKLESSSTVDTSTWDTSYKYAVSASTFTGFVGNVTHTSWDIYRYETCIGAWVPAGVKYDLDKKTWTSLNLKTVSGLSTSSYANMIAKITEIFKTGISKYVNLDDVAFHQAFVRFLSGTDNRAKNTYFQMVGPVYVDEVYTEETAAAANAANVNNPDWTIVSAGELTGNLVLPDTISDDCYAVRMMGDDLDTVIVTDNNGLQSKPYNLLEASYNEEHRKYWGDDNNIFFYMFDQCFEELIRTQLVNILQVAFSNSDVTNTANYFYKVFFDVQDNQFPAVAYNHQAKIYYENAQFIYDSGIIPVYTNNDVNVPLSQSHGSSSACEKQFMQKRYNFLASYARQSGGNDFYNFMSSTGGSGVQEARLVLKFSTYQDFYPTYYWNRDTDVRYLGALQSDAKYDISKYLAHADQDYELTLNVKESGINNAIRQTSLYKTLDITGSQNNQLISQFTHLTDLTMDNANMVSDLFKDWPEVEINTFTPSAPVLESIALCNMNLPTQMDLSAFYKLKKVDFTGTNVQYVLFPQSGRLQTAILPETITEFRIYNNPGLKAYNQELNEGIVLPENLSALKVVYVAANKCGNFDVQDFVNRIVDLSLTECTLRNLDISITQEVLVKLLQIPKISLTGHINIIDEESQQTAISFNTLQTLVSMFGDVNDSSNSLYVTYTKETITTVKAPATLALYGNSGITASVSPIIELGNNATIITENGKSRLDITYSLKASNSFSANTFDTTVATIDSVTGTITLKKESSKKGYIFITVGTDSGDKTTAQTYTCEVSFEWTAPKLGDFAYSDGTFSTSYIPSKTLVGLVYAVNESTTTSGTAYIIGKEYASDNAYMFGYSGESGSLMASQYPTSSYYLNRYVKTTLGITGTYTGADKGLASFTDQIAVNSLTKQSYEDAGAADAAFTGKTDTAQYINMVNSEGLPTIYQKYSAVRDNLKSNSDGSYYIGNISDFNAVYRTLSNVKVGSDDTANYSDYSQYIMSKLATAVIYPYVYSIYLYQPEGNEIDSRYLAGNWYVPSLSQLQRVLYLRGISAQDVFTDANYVRKSIDGSATSDEAIFSRAYNAMGASNFPTCWSNIAGSGASASSGGSSNSNNIVTTMNTTSGNNYSYQYTGGSQSWDTYSYTNKWQSGMQPTVSQNGSYFDTYYDSYPGSLNAWRLSAHQGIPFVEFNYAKPS